MERTFAITAAAILLSATIVLSLIYLSGGFSPKQEASVQKTDAPVSSEAETVPKKMKLGIYGGYLALFIGDGRYPNEIYEVTVRSLPETDRERLADGIEINSEAELREIIEDLTS